MRGFYRLLIMMSLVTLATVSGEARGRSTGPVAKIKEASRLMKSENYEEASLLLFSLRKTRMNRNRRDQVLWMLGRSLAKMELYQSAAFQYLDLVKRGRGNYFKNSLSEFFELADRIESKSFLDYAIEKVVKNKNKVMRTQAFSYRYGQYLLSKRKFKAAAQSLTRVRVGNKYYSRAIFLLGLTYAELGQENRAIASYKKLLSFHSKDDVTSYNKNSAKLGLARIYYQKKKWQSALDYYRQLPKDSELWHDVLLEMSWTHFRAGQFREVLGLLSSLHSAYYKDHFLPESVLLRALVYLAICQIDETKKTLLMFYDVYRPMRLELSDYLRSTRRYSDFYKDGKVLVQALRSNEISESMRKKTGLPVPVARTLINNPEIRRTFKYIQSLNSELELVEDLDSDWRSSKLGREVKGLLKRRSEFAKKLVGQQIRSHLKSVKRKFASHFRQYDFIKYEIRSERKRQAREELKGNKVKNSPERLSADKGLARNYFSNLGIEYWPFNGEYWLDEIGNYHYLGGSRCVAKK